MARALACCVARVRKERVGILPAGKSSAGVPPAKHVRSAGFGPLFVVQALARCS